MTSEIVSLAFNVLRSTERRVKDVRRQPHKTGDSQGRAGVRNILFRDYVSRNHNHRRVTALSFGPGQISTDEILLSMLKHYRPMRDRRVIKHARERRLVYWS